MTSCDVCGKKGFKNNKSLSNHKRWHNPSMKYKKKPINKIRVVCDTCDSIVFKWKSLIGEKNFCSKDCSNEYKKTLVGSRSPKWKGGSFCECGKEKVHNAKSCKSCWYSTIFGESNPNWNGGSSFEPYPVAFNIKLKELIRERDNRTCQGCGIKEEDSKRRLDVHHIDHNKDNLSPNNLISTCRSCNAKANYDKALWKEYYMAKVGGRNYAIHC